MPTSAWKRNERSRKSIGARRNQFEREDCSHSLFSIECKMRSLQNYLRRLRDWFEQAKVGASEGKSPLLAIHLAGEIRGNDLVILGQSDFEDLLGRLSATSESCSHVSIQRQGQAPVPAMP